jgi:hypothetical protein
LGLGRISRIQPWFFRSLLESFVALGAQACLFKPFDPQQLEEILNRTFATPMPS